MTKEQEGIVRDYLDSLDKNEIIKSNFGPRNNRHFDSYVFSVQVEYQLNNVQELKIPWKDLHSYIKYWLETNE